MLTATQQWNLTVRLEVWAPAHSICYLQTISSLSSPAQSVERRSVTCSKGTNTSTPIILKREAKITSAQTARRVFGFFGPPPHADRFECSLLCLWGGRRTTQELCFLVTATVPSAHFLASVNSPPWLDTASSAYSTGTITDPPATLSQQPYRSIIK